MGGGSGNYASGYGGGGNNNFLSYLGVPDSNNQFTGGTPLLGGQQQRDPRWQFPLKKPGVPNDPNTDWYGYSMAGLNASTQFPPPQNFFGQGTKML